MKNKIFYIYDKNNDIATNAFLAVDEQIAKLQIVDSIKKTFYIMKNSKNVNEQANIANYINNAKNYELKNQNNDTILKLKDIIDVQIENENAKEPLKND